MCVRNIDAKLELLIKISSTQNVQDGRLCLDLRKIPVTYKVIHIYIVAHAYKFIILLLFLHCLSSLLVIIRY